MPRIEALTPKFATKDRFALIELLMDVVEAGAAISFLPPMTEGEAGAFWDKALSDLSHRSILVARDAAGRIQGSVQLIPAAMPNQPHRADIAKMMVAKRARGRRVGAMLLTGVEALAIAQGRTTLVLDTISGSAAARLYERAGWEKVGDIPAYALMPGGKMAPTTVYTKRLS